MARILILSQSMRETDRLRRLLGDQGHQVALCEPAEPALRRAVEERRPDLLLLHANGCRPEVAPLRAASRPNGADEAPGVIVLTTRQGLPLLEPSAPIDDFVLLPCEDEELLHRVRVVLHRLNRSNGDSVIHLGDLTLDPASYSVTVRGEPIDLTYKEYQLLKFLASHPGRVYTRDDLLTQVWGYDYYGGTRTVDVHVRRIRAKLGPPCDRLVETVHNVGYKLSPPRP